MKKSKKRTIEIGQYISPYRQSRSENISFDNLYHQYCNDPDRMKKENNRTFYRIISSCTFTLRGKRSILVMIDTSINVKVKDYVVDENEIRYQVLAFEMIRFANEIPEWYLKCLTMLISGDIRTLGQYLARDNIEGL